MERPKGRRSSILSQAAQQEGYEIHMEQHVAELVKQLPQSLVANAARHSAGFQISRHSNTTTTHDLIQYTPVNRDYPNTGYRGYTSKPSSIPRPVPHAIPGRGGGGVSSKSAQGKVVRILEPQPQCYSALPTSTSRRRSRSVQRGETASRPQGLSRAMSSDSLFTPGRPGTNTVTPRTFGLGKSPGKAKMVFSEKTGNVAKTLKPPDMKDKRAINMLGLMVNGFLQDHQYPQRMSLENFNKLSLSQYLDACRFTLQLMMGSSFLTGLKQDELKAKLMEISVLFKYPGTLSNSVLKSPNSTHSWPFALTFLAFLVCRVEAAITPISSMNEHPINEIKNPESYLDDILVESKCRLYFQLISTGRFSIEPELEFFKQRLREMLSDDPSKTIEQIVALLQEKQQCLEEKIAQEDPRKELFGAVEAQSKLLSDLNKRKSELQEQLKKFKEVDAVLARRSSLVHNLEVAKAENSKADEIIKTQIVDFAKRKILLKDIDELRVQRAVVEQVNDTSKRKLQGREQYVQNAQQRFYEVCSRLNVANSFNQHLHKLEHLKEVENMQRMKDNPFNAELLGPWLKSSRRVHRHTKQIITQLRDEMQDKIYSMHNSIIRYGEKECGREIASKESLSKVESIRQTEEKELSHLNDEITKLNRIVVHNKEDLEEAKMVCSNDEIKIQEAEHECSKIEKKLETEVQKSEDFSQRKAKIVEDINMYDGPILQKVQELMLQHLEKRRTAYLDDFGIDILADDEDSGEPRPDKVT